MSHWSEQREKRGSVFHMRFLFLSYKYLGPRVIKVLLHPVVLAFAIFSGKTRMNSIFFLEKVFAMKGWGKKPGFSDVYRHFYCFSYALIEKLAAWSGVSSSESLVVKTADARVLSDQLAANKGAVALCSHLGNAEMLRAFGSLETGDRLPNFQTISIVDFSGTAHFNTLLKEINPDSMVKLIDANSIDPSVIIYLKERIDQGDLIVIAGDRTAGKNREKSTAYTFLGETAHFPRGAFILACLLDAPVFYMFALRENDKDLDSPYEFHVFKSSQDESYTRKNRDKLVEGMTAEYAGYLETLCLAHPYQWFNFFNFWENSDQENKEEANG